MQHSGSPQETVVEYFTPVGTHVLAVSTRYAVSTSACVISSAHATTRICLWQYTLCSSSSSSSSSNNGSSSTFSCEQQL
jgi:hypothetical protein